MRSSLRTEGVEVIHRQLPVGRHRVLHRLPTSGEGEAGGGGRRGSWGAAARVGALGSPADRLRTSSAEAIFFVSNPRARMARPQAEVSAFWSSES